MARTTARPPGRPLLHREAFQLRRSPGNRSLPEGLATRHDAAANRPKGLDPPDVPRSEEALAAVAQEGGLRPRGKQLPLARLPPLGLASGWSEWVLLGI